MTVTQDARHARIMDPETSHEAAERVDLPRRCAEAFEAARLLGVFTDSELAKTMTVVTGRDVQRNVAARRRLDLERKGIVVAFCDNVGSQMKRIGPEGRAEAVWTVA